MVARQESKRGGWLTVAWDQEKKTVKISGKAREVASGKMVLPE